MQHEHLFHRGVYHIQIVQLDSHSFKNFTDSKPIESDYHLCKTFISVISREVNLDGNHLRHILKML